MLELHVEQGRGLVDRGAPVGLCSAIWPHGRWRLDLRGEANHAGTTRLEDRRDPVLGLAAAALAARAAAARRGAVATIGRVEVAPNATNSVAGQVAAWLDARAPDDAALDGLVDDVRRAAAAAAAEHRLDAGLTAESRSPAVAFDGGLLARLAALLRARGLDPPALPTAAGHDAGALAAAGVPAAMLLVRNPTGASHTPAEHAEVDDCVAGVEALAAAVEELACR